MLASDWPWYFVPSDFGEPGRRSMVQAGNVRAPSGDGKQNFRGLLREPQFDFRIADLYDCERASSDTRKRYAASIAGLEMRLVVNGEEMDLAGVQTVSELLEHLEIDPRYRAVAVNRAVVPRAEFGQRELQDGDRVEIVRPVSGG